MAQHLWPQQVGERCFSARSDAAHFRVSSRELSRGLETFWRRVRRHGRRDHPTCLVNRHRTSSTSPCNHLPSRSPPSICGRVGTSCGSHLRRRDSAEAWQGLRVRRVAREARPAGNLSLAAGVLDCRDRRRARRCHRCSRRLGLRRRWHPGGDPPRERDQRHPDRQVRPGMGTLL